MCTFKKGMIFFEVKVDVLLVFYFMWIVFKLFWFINHYLFGANVELHVVDENMFNDFSIGK